MIEWVRDVNKRSARARDTFRAQLWPLPALAVVVAVGLGRALPVLDAALDNDMPQDVAGLLFGAVRKRRGRCWKQSRVR